MINTIAYYLGQFHPIEENNKFWGDGFSEWHNVAKARPLFPGHSQPILPGKLGFYDLRCDDTLIEQTDYALSIGVSCFCHWHYWFGGKRLLHRAFDRMLDLPDRGMKLMLGWANESWTGIWHGLDKKVMIKQTYDRDELKRHAQLISTYVRSDRYLKLDSLSPFLIYKPRSIPNSLDYLSELRDEVRKCGGGELYLVGTWGPGRSERINEPAALGLDAVVANNVGCFFETDFGQKLYAGTWHFVKKLGLGPEVRAYDSTIRTLEAAHRVVKGVVHSTVVTGWDNTPRTGRRGLVLTNYNDRTFSNALSIAIEYERKNQKKLLFLKSWNEWAEGNVIEPKFNEQWSVGDLLAEKFRRHG